MSLAFVKRVLSTSDCSLINLFVPVYTLLFVFILVGCNTNPPKPSYLGKDPYTVAVYEEMLQMDQVKIADIEDAFAAYLTTHKLDKIEQKWVRKQIKFMKMHEDHRGYYVSPELQYEKLLAYRNPTPKESGVTSTMQAPMMGSIVRTIPNPNGEGAWKNIGPFGNPDVQWSATGSGALHYVEFHPTDPSIMYVCARNAGLFKTTDYGAHWENMTSHFPTPHAFSVEVNQMDPTIIYLAGKGTLYYSSDEGETWDDRSGIIKGEIYDITSDPINPDRAILSSTQGIYLTTDAGLTWTQMITGNFSDIDLKEDFSLIMVSKNNTSSLPTMFYSVDRGDTWIQRTIVSGIGNIDKIYLALHENPTGDDVIMAYGLKNDNTPTRFVGLWKSSFVENPAAGQDTFNFVEVKHPTYNYPNGPVPLKIATNPNGFEEEDAGDQYGGINPLTTSTWVSELWISPNDSLKLITARQKMWGSDDGGVIWQYQPSYGGSNWADNRYMTMNMAKDTIFWCNDGGLWAIAESDMFPTPAEVDASGLSRIDYMSSKVVPKNGNICLQEGEQMDVSLMNKDVFMTGGQDIGQVFERAGRSTHVASADVYRGRIKPTDDQYFINGRLVVELVGGSTVSLYDNIEADKGNPDRIYGFSLGTTALVRSPLGVDGWETTNFLGEHVPNPAGKTSDSAHPGWEVVTFNGTGITTINSGTFEQSRANTELAFFGDEIGGRLFMTENLSSANPTWTELVGLPSSDLYRIATHDIYEDIIVVGTSAGIYISKDKGQTWFSRPGIPESSFIRVLLDKNRLEDIYVMTDMNVYYHSAESEGWEEFNKGLPLFQNQDMRIGYFENGDNRIYVAKYGSGVWSSPLESVLEDNQYLPIADFKIHGNSSNSIEVGNEVQLINLSVNADSLHWVIENGSDVITIVNEDYPKAVLNTLGYYKVTLTAVNDNGSDIETKEYYILVHDPNYVLPTLLCTPDSTLDLVWYVGLDNISLDGDYYNDISSANYQSKDKTFDIANDSTNHIVLKDNYIPGYNFWWKAYIDYDNDGAFTAGELLFDSGAPVDSVNTTFTIPSTATFNTPLHFRVSGRGNGLEPDECGTSTNDNRQVIDMKVILRNVITITQTDTIVTPTSTKLTADYTGGLGVVAGGFLLSTVDGDFNIDNSSVYPYAGALANDDSYNMTIDDLLPNTVYYYKAYVVDQGTYTYAEKDSFFAPPAALMPYAEAVIALDLGNQELELQGMFFSNNVDITSVAFIHGENDFANETNMDVAVYPTDIKQFLNTTVTTPTGATSYQFKIRAVTASGDTLFSNTVFADLNNTLCTPTTSSGEWWQKWGEITLNGVTYSNGGTSTPIYEDATQVIFDLETGNTYTATLTHTWSGWAGLDFYVFIDLNNDSDFDDAGELVGGGGPDDVATDIEITIPTRYNLRGQDLRMRVLGTRGSSLDPCNLSFGNVKDFTVHLDRCTPVRIVDVDDTPFVDGKTFWAQDSVIIQDNLLLPDFFQLIMDAPLVKVEGQLTPGVSSKVEIRGDGCMVE